MKRILTEELLNDVAKVALDRALEPFMEREPIPPSAMVHMGFASGRPIMTDADQDDRVDEFAKRFAYAQMSVAVRQTNFFGDDKDMFEFCVDTNDSLFVRTCVMRRKVTLDEDNDFVLMIALAIMDKETLHEYDSIVAALDAAQKVLEEAYSAAEDEPEGECRCGCLVADILGAIGSFSDFVGSDKGGELYKALQDGYGNFLEQGDANQE
ncbi:hypothetical protein FWH09_01670 [Candidatus Saccharibacteria bacterium]|nr:hypothetical protein [Candidatus Saccharibacteria bacterium]